MRLLNVLKNLRRALSRHQPLVSVLISRSALLNNLRIFQNLRPGVAIAPVLKSNAYGHGLIPVAKIFDREKIPFMAVDAIFEAQQLKSAGIRNTILVLDYVRPPEIVRTRLRDVHYSIVSLDQLHEVAKTIKKKTHFHIKIDTGMHRQGIQPSEVADAIRILKSQPLLCVVGIFSHLADAVGHSEFTKTVQLAAWHEQLSIFEKEFSTIRFKHIFATSGFALSESVNANVARVGIGLFGIAPFLNAPLTPALQLTTSIVEIKTIEAGETVGYNNTFTAQKHMRLGVLPLGYYEGVDLRLSGCGQVKLAGSYCPIVGRVSMNVTTIDISEMPAASVGTEVTVLCREATDVCSVQRTAERCHTIPYEILVHLPPHLRRVIV